MLIALLLDSRKVDCHRWVESHNVNQLSMAKMRDKNIGIYRLALIATSLMTVRLTGFIFSQKRESERAPAAAA